MNPRDRQLARRMLAGEEAAFDEFFDGYFPALYRFAMPRVNRDADAAEEVVQATLTAAISKLSTYRGEAALFTWLCTFCRHEISRFYRRAKRRPATIDLTEETPEVMAALDTLWVMADDGPHRSLERKEIARMVQVTLDRLPPRYGEALEWKYTDGVPVREIGARMGLSEKAAESLLTRARNAFRDGFSALARRASTPGLSWESAGRK